MTKQWQIDYIREQIRTCPPDKRAYWRRQLRRAIRKGDKR